MRARLWREPGSNRVEEMSSNRVLSVSSSSSTSSLSLSSTASLHHHHHRLRGGVGGDGV